MERRTKREINLKKQEKIECNGGMFLDHHKRQAYCIFGLFISVLGFVWVAHDVGWVSLNMPFGPIIATSIGLAMIIATLPKVD